jgi:hypothetical protein
MHMPPFWHGLDWQPVPVDKDFTQPGQCWGCPVVGPMQVVPFAHGDVPLQKRASDAGHVPFVKHKQNDCGE